MSGKTRDHQAGVGQIIRTRINLLKLNFFIQVPGEIDPLPKSNSVIKGYSMFIPIGNDCFLLDLGMCFKQYRGFQIG